MRLRENGEQVVALALVLLLMAGLVTPSRAHEDDKAKKLPPTKAKKDLIRARSLMDTAKMKLMAQGRYACCIKPPKEAKVLGCDLCAKENGSCNCASNLAQGKGVCGECLGGWKAGRGALKGVDAKTVTLLASPRQKMADSSTLLPPELKEARDILNNAKRTMVKENRFACCIGHGGCDECAYETVCPCGKAAQQGQKGEGICGTCLDGWHAGIGRFAGLSMQDMKLAEMHMDHLGSMMPIAGVSMSRQASGTAWQPDDTPMYMAMRDSGRWNLMTMANAFLFYDRQDGPRGDYQFGSTNWGMLMARRPVGKDQLQLRAMLSLEPLTVTPAGYPVLLQSGESYSGKPLVDRQHPHDLFMELAARYIKPLGSDSAFSLYYGLSGEPALGPPAYPHRLSAMDNPAAPITHHWQDSSHIAFGVLTAGVWKRNVQLEGSWFTGREPDENRYDLSPMHMDSFSGRLTFNPGRNWSLQASYGSIHSPELLHPEDDMRRTTASAMYVTQRHDGGFWATTFGYGRNNGHGVNSDSYLLETSLNLAQRNTIFARYEFVNKLGEELNLAPADKQFGIGQFSLGVVHDFAPQRSYQAGVGAMVTFSSFPAELKPIYGDSPTSFWLFFRVRLAPMQH